MRKKFLKDIAALYSSVKPAIRSRIKDFKELGSNAGGKELFAELAFCLLTPQSKAKACFAAVDGFIRDDLLFKGDVPSLSRRLNCVRFKNNKARYIAAARDQFCQKGSLKKKLRGSSSSKEARKWFAENVLGLGYKEASHFLRNIGRGEELAILDRHILKNLVLAGVIREVPSSLSPKKYLEIEDKMRKFAALAKIPLSHLDLLLWFKETGEVFK